MRRYSTRAILVALVTVCILPTLLVSAGLVYENYQLQKERINRDTVLLARNLVSALDRELSGVESGLRVLATSPDLAAGDLASFHQHAREALKFQIVNNYVLTDSKGRQRINTLAPYGAPLPKTGTPPALQRVFADGKPVITGLFIGPVTHAPVIAMGVPVFRRGEVVYSLNIGLSPDRIGAILTRQSLPEGWIAVVLDGSGTIVARSKDPERFVGQKGAPVLVADSLAQREGTLETRTLEGIDVLTAFSRSSVSDWSVAVGAPRSDLTGGLYRSIRWIAAAAASALGVALLLAVRLASGIRSAIKGLIAPALALGTGKQVQWPGTRLKEAEAVGEAIAQASRTLARAQHLAHHDALTGLCNRVLFEQLASHELAAARRNGTPLAILAIDLDEFKAVNDLQGHAAGDRVLKIASERITAAIRESDVVARWGGDEFVVLLPDAGLDSATLVGNKLLAVLSEPYPDIAPAVSASVGIAIFPWSGVTVADLHARADVALYEAKTSGKRRLTVDV